jgi:chromate reductase, NAD(P)H dehydrogenase (quinone)
MYKLNVLGISGSLRQGSFNRKALQVAKRFAAQAGADVAEADLKELALPIYDGDIEDRGMPDSVLRLKAAVEASHVVLVASPEYNHSISGALKNAIDWLSRGKNSLDGKVAAVFGASTGVFGTARGQYHLRQTLTALNVIVIPQPQVLIGTASAAFHPDGAFQNPKTEELLQRLIGRALKTASQLQP